MSPTRASLLTGRNHHEIGNGQIAELANDWDGYAGKIPRSSATVAEVLKQYGYATAAFGKWHNTPAEETTAAGPFEKTPTDMAERAKLIGTQSMKVAQPGNPGPVKTGFAPMPDQPEYGTSHISIVDAFGNAVAMTTTIEDQFGSRQMVTTSAARRGGFLLNNELTDFSFAPTDAQGQPIANRVQPGKRPRCPWRPRWCLTRPAASF